MLSQQTTHSSAAAVGKLLLLVSLALPLGASSLDAQIVGERTQFLDQNSPGMPNSNDEDDLFGAALAAGDFDGDGYPDLVIQTQNERVGKVSEAGQVTVVRGSADGLDPILGAEVWSEGLGLLAGDADFLDYFGASLAVGDFDADQIDDLAIAVPGADPVVDGLPVLDAGLVYVLWGSGVGLTHQGFEALTAGSLGLPGSPSQFEPFGARLASGDFDGDGVADLALATPRWRFEPDGGAGVNGAGRVDVLYGSGEGLSVSPAEGVPGFSTHLADFGWAPSQFDFFGETMTSGDFNGDGFDDLAVTAQGREVAGADGAGMVFVFWGSDEGLTTVGVQQIHRGVPGLWGTPAENDLLGRALAAGDFDGDGVDELVIGVEMADLLTSDEGIAYVVPGTEGGPLDTAATILLTQAIVGAGLPELSARFGQALTTGDLDGDQFTDLVISAPGLSAGGFSNAGRLWVVRGGAGGLDPGGAQELTHGDLEIGPPQQNDFFGNPLLAADFDDDGAADLVAGVPYLGADDAGAVDVFYGILVELEPPLFADGFEAGDAAAWSAAVW